MGSKGLKIMGIGVILILIQSFFQQYDTLAKIYSRYIGYLIPVIYAFFIAIFLEPVVTFFEEKGKVKRAVSITLTVLLILILIAGFIGVVAPQIGKSIKELYIKLPFMQDKAEFYIEEIIRFLKKKGLIVIGDAELQQSILDFVKKNTRYLQDVGISALLNIVWWTVALTKFFIGFFLAILILINKEYFIDFFQKILKLVFKGEKGENFIIFLEKSREILLKFVCGRIIVSVAVGFITFVVMLFTGTPYSLLTGVMMGVGNMIPYVGSIVAGILAVFLVVLAEPDKLIFLFLAIVIAQAVDGWIIGPKIVGESVGMGTFWIIVSILIGGSLFGPIGMFFGVPIFAMIKLIYHSCLKKEEEKKILCQKK
ncbi:AI-2E family transporter [Fusobacterium sp.]|uniref:AI-2E family transporter n=1 Tax=Fusobacterium sp. TaxID=68766 RepID=UPI00396CA661